MKMLKKMLAILLCLCALATAAGAEGNEALLENFVLKHGDRNEKKSALRWTTATCPGGITLYGMSSCATNTGFT